MAQWLFPPCNFGFKITLRWFSDYKIEGLENIPEVRPLLIASNHLSNLDPAIIAAALPEAPVFLAKKELFKFSAGSFLLRGYGAYPVDRRGADIRALKWITDQLVSDHRIVMMFPEGTRSKTGGLLKGQPGLAHLAITTGATVVPIALSGAAPVARTAGSGTGSRHGQGRFPGLPQSRIERSDSRDQARLLRCLR